MTAPLICFSMNKISPTSGYTCTGIVQKSLTCYSIFRIFAKSDHIGVGKVAFRSRFKDTMENYYDKFGSTDTKCNIYEKARSNGIIGRLYSGVVFGVVFSKKWSQIGKKPPQNRPHRFGAVPVIIIVSDVSELSPNPCHPPFTPATGVQIPLGTP